MSRHGRLRSHTCRSRRAVRWQPCSRDGNPASQLNKAPGHRSVDNISSKATSDTRAGNVNSSDVSATGYQAIGAVSLAVGKAEPGQGNATAPTRLTAIATDAMLEGRLPTVRPGIAGRHATPPLPPTGCW